MAETKKKVVKCDKKTQIEKKEQKLDFNKIIDIIMASKDYDEININIEDSSLSLSLKKNSSKEISTDFSLNHQTNDYENYYQDDDFSEQRLNKLKAQHRIDEVEQTIFTDPDAYMESDDSIIRQD